ncbi:MAG TPA: phosphotransferase, partial [Trebonia sp.]|nr:phosphotransferase [Trebonia sp.]
GEDEAVTVTGLIDFGDACGGRPLDDLALLCWEWPEVDRAALAAGYGAAPFWTDQGRRLALGQFRMLIGYTAHDLRAGSRPVPRLTWPGSRPCSPPRPCEITHNALPRKRGRQRG